MAFLLHLRSPYILQRSTTGPSSFPRFRSVSIIRLNASVGSSPLRRATRSIFTSAKTRHPQTSVPTTWVDRLPIKWRPYFFLTRIDKPIGTFLLFYPCGARSIYSFVKIPCSTRVLTHSLVHYNGILCNCGAYKHSTHLSWSLRPWCSHHARSGLYH